MDLAALKRVYMNIEKNLIIATVVITTFFFAYVLYNQKMARYFL